jgi:hypothetical protein
VSLCAYSQQSLFEAKRIELSFQFDGTTKVVDLDVSFFALDGGSSQLAQCFDFRAVLRFGEGLSELQIRFSVVLTS